MTFTIKPWHGVVGIIAIILWGLTLTSISPYFNNHFHSHRWRTDLCKKKGVPIEACTIALPPLQNMSTEQPQFDVCLEHGEWRRIK